MEYALKLENVSKSYKDFTLDNINISLPYGSIMGFVGENGSGKTTTIKLILDLIKRDSGIITILGQDNVDNKNIKQLKEHIGVVMDESCFPEMLTLMEVNKVLKNIYKTWDERKFGTLAKQFSLHKNKKIKDYSKGMKMKLSIAIALAHDAKILILDEATSGLDPLVRDEILDVFRDFIQNDRHSIFMTSHIISDLEKICDYITLIHNGKIILNKSTDELIDNYGILKCSEADFKTITPTAVKGFRKNAFGVEALVIKKEIKGDFVVDKASIENIMVYSIKEARCNESTNH